jgi:hypothetical protein
MMENCSDGESRYVLPQDLNKSMIGVGIRRFFRLQARAEGLLPEVDEEMGFLGKTAFSGSAEGLALKNEARVFRDPGF